MSTSLRRDSLRAWAGVAILLMLAPWELTWATAFFINQQSVRGLGRVDAGNTVAAEDLGTIFFNPAGLIQFWNDNPRNDYETSIGVHLIIPRNDQRNRGSTIASAGTLGNFVPYAGGDTKNPTDPTPIPNLYAAKKFANGRASVGIGINAPFGLETRSRDDWFGRYDAIEASLRTINVGLVGAYRFDSGIAIGGGIDMQYARTTLTSAIPNPFVPGGPTASTDGRIATKGDDWTPGFHIGLLYPLTQDGKSRIGAHYRSGMKHQIKGASSVTGLTGPLTVFNGEIGASAELRLPAIATVGIRAQVTDRLALLGEVEWFDWSTFQEIRIRFDDGRPDGVRLAHYRDAYAFALGADYHVGGSPWRVRGGIHYDTTPTVDQFRDTTVPDAARLWLGLGTSYELSKTASVDFAFNHVFFRNTSIDLTRTFFDGTPLVTTARINSDVKSVVNTVSVEFRFGF
jgi:long-chain fatty acid transport protein